MLRVGFLASNNGSAMRAIVGAIAEGRLQAVPCLLVSNKEVANAVCFARDKGIRTRIIPTLPDAEEADKALCEALMAANIDVVVLTGYLRKLGDRTLRAFAGRILNTHPALLPKFGGKGMYGRRVHEAVLAAGELTTGVTIHVVDAEYDHGKIIAQRAVAVPKGATVEIVEKTVLAAEQSLFIEILEKISTGALHL